MTKIILSLSFFFTACSTTHPKINLAANDRVARLVAGGFAIDAHNHIDVPLEASQLPGPKLDLAGDLNNSGLTSIGATFAVDYQKFDHNGQAYERFLNGLEAMDYVLESNNLKRVLTESDLRQAVAQHQPIIVQAVEGAHFLEGKMSRLKLAYQKGLRHLGLLHDNDASVPLGDVYTNPPRWGGLTEFGKGVVIESERLGILVDVTHCDDHTIDMVLSVAKKPVIASHTGLVTQHGRDSRQATRMKPRLISAYTAKKIAAAGGAVCVWTHLSESPKEYAQNIRAMVNAIGVDHVCLGTDTKLTPAIKPKGQEGERSGERTNQAWEDQLGGFYFVVADALIKEGFTDEEIRKIGGENYVRVLSAALRK